MADNAAFSMKRPDAVSVWHLQAWPGGKGALHSAVAGTDAINVAPGRYWLIGGDGVNYDDAIAVTDISDSLVCFLLSGESVRDVLSKGLPIDIDAREFSDGACATSMIEGITATVLRRGESFDVYCNRSYASSLEHWFKQASREFVSGG